MEAKNFKLEASNVEGRYDLYLLEDPGPTYQLMFLTTSTGNFTEVINKDTCVQLAIRANLFIEADTVSPKKVKVNRPESNVVHTIKIPQPA